MPHDYSNNFFLIPKNTLVVSYDLADFKCQILLYTAIKKIWKAPLLMPIL